MVICPLGFFNHKEQTFNLVEFHYRVWKYFFKNLVWFSGKLPFSASPENWQAAPPWVGTATCHLSLLQAPPPLPARGADFLLWGAGPPSPVLRDPHWCRSINQLAPGTRDPLGSLLPNPAQPACTEPAWGVRFPGWPLGCSPCGLQMSQLTGTGTRETWQSATLLIFANNGTLPLLKKFKLGDAKPVRRPWYLATWNEFSANSSLSLIFLITYSYFHSLCLFSVGSWHRN